MCSVIVVVSAIIHATCHLTVYNNNCLNPESECVASGKRYLNLQLSTVSLEETLTSTNRNSDEEDDFADYVFAAAFDLNTEPTAVHNCET